MNHLLGSLVSALQQKIGNRVTITELQRPGIITAVFIGESGLQLRVRYFANGEAKETYFYPEEVTEG